jgi:hypothetical protein
MIILGDISGIQNYLFDVAEEGGGQARRLRARSFLVATPRGNGRRALAASLGLGVDVDTAVRRRQVLAPRASFPGG